MSHKQVLDTHIPHENELSTTTVTAKPIWKSMLVWLYYIYSVSYSETYLNNNMHYIMQAKQCNSTHYTFRLMTYPSWPIHPIPFPPGEMPQEVMSCFFCVHSAKSGLRRSMLCPFLCKMTPVMTPTITIGASKSTVLYAGNGIVFLPTAAVLLRRKINI